MTSVNIVGTTQFQLFTFNTCSLYSANTLKEAKCTIESFHLLLNIILCHCKFDVLWARLTIVDTEDLNTPNALAVFLN